jgi:type II restriction enzyme
MLHAIVGYKMEVIKQIESVLADLAGKQVERPRGTLSGHAAGQPFEVLVHDRLRGAWPETCRRHFEMLNEILLANPLSTSPAQRLALFGPASVAGLVARGARPMGLWTPSNLFEEKQNDTAESIILNRPIFHLDNNPVTLVDVKSHNNAKKGQPPNIMSAGKLAKACKQGLQEGSIEFDIVYVSVKFDPATSTLDCTEVRTVSIFKVASPLYINWAAAEQVQFVPHKVDQDYQDSKEHWARAFLQTFCDSLERKIGKDSLRLKEYRAVL